MAFLWGCHGLAGGGRKVVGSSLKRPQFFSFLGVLVVDGGDGRRLWHGEGAMEGFWSWHTMASPIEINHQRSRCEWALGF